jgi:hypothetical protein
MNNGRPVAKLQKTPRASKDDLQGGATPYPAPSPPGPGAGPASNRSGCLPALPARTATGDT